MTEIRIRPATREDVSLVLSFISELAEYEKLSHEVVATEELIHENLFGNKQVAEVLIAEHQDGPAGFALYFHNYSTFLGRAGIYLEDLFVRPAFRGQGIGKKLLVQLAQIAVDRGCGRLEWAVLDWNSPAIDFYEALGALSMDEWTTYRVTGSTLKKLADTPL